MARFTRAASRCSHSLWIFTLLLAGMLSSVAVQAASEPRASRSTFEKLIAVQEMWEEENYSEAITTLEALAEKVRGADYDFAITQQYLAHTSYLAGDVPRTRKALEAALATPGLPEKLELELKLFFAQILVGDEEFERARALFEDWLAGADIEPQPAQLFSAAFANYRSGYLPRAETLIVQALDIAKKKDTNWYRLYYEILFELKKYETAEAVLVDLVALAPRDKMMWNLLINHHLRLENSARALSVMLLSRYQGIDEDEDSRMRLVSLYSYLAVPERAARLLQEWLEAGEIEETPQTLRQLGDLWLLARERPQAREMLERAAAVAPDGRTWELLGGLLFEDELWEQAYTAYTKAQEAGGLNEPARIALLAGLSAYRAGMEEQAREALKEAEKSDEMKAQARAILKKLDS